MRNFYPVFMVFGVLVAGGSVQAQPKEDPLLSRFNILYNGDLYVQKTPKDTLGSILLAMERERLDYVFAHLMDPAFVDARLASTQVYYEKLAKDDLIQRGELPKHPVDAAKMIQKRANKANFDYLMASVQKKLSDDPQSLRDLKRFYREGEFQDGGETATVTHKDIKDRQIFFRKIGERWFMDNKREDEKANKD